jgi:hypothetical protein
MYLKAEFTKYGVSFQYVEGLLLSPLSVVPPTAV